MSSGSKTYRICCFDPAQSTLSAELIEAESDEEAIEKAEALGFSKCELWEGRRLVAVLDDEEGQPEARRGRPFAVANSQTAVGTPTP